MKIGVVVFPCDATYKDVIYSIKNSTSHQIVEIWYKDTDIGNVDAVIIPSVPLFTDIFDAPIIQQIIAFGYNGGVIVGVGSGFDILCQLDLLVGEVKMNTNGKFICKNIFVRGESEKLPFTSRELMMPVAIKKGAYYIDENEFNYLKNNDLILFRFCNNNGEITKNSNPTGATDNIAGICNTGRNIYGILFHPERAADDELGNTDGSLIIQFFFRIMLKKQN